MTCPNCSGKGQTPDSNGEMRTCWGCGGDGQVPDPPAKRLTPER